MTFWTYCEKVENCVGLKVVIDHIRDVRHFWNNNFTVGECCSFLADKVLEEGTKLSCKRK
jgi:hypothetical protein